MSDNHADRVPDAEDTVDLGRQDLGGQDSGGQIDPENYDAAEELDQLLAEDSQTRGEDPLEDGYSPPERPLGMWEETTLDQRLAEEVPEEDPGRDGDDTTPAEEAAVHVREDEPPEDD